MTKTERYQLNQWEASDQVRRTDFNEDNAKIEQALAGQADALGMAEQRVTEYYSAFINLAYPIFLQAAKDYETLKTIGIRQNLFVDTFDTADYVASLTGEMRVSSGTLFLSNTAAPATMTTVPIDLTDITWSRVMVWVRCDAGAEYVLSINGIVMTQTGSWSGKSLSGSKCTELQLEADISSSSSATFVFSVTPHPGYPGRIYEYGALFF